MLRDFEVMHRSPVNRLVIDTTLVSAATSVDAWELITTYFPGHEILSCSEKKPAPTAPVIKPTLRERIFGRVSSRFGRIYKRR